MTLIEVMVAVLLIGFGLSSFVASFLAASRAAESSSRRIQAVHRGRQELETLRTCPYNDSRLALGTHIPTNGISYTVSTASDFPATKNIRLSVDWKRPGDKQPRQVVLWSSMASCIHP